MKDKLLLFIGYIFILAGAIKFDLYIYPTLDYFGKFVFVIALNLLPFWLSWDLYKRNKLYSLGFAIIAGIVLYLMG